MLDKLPVLSRPPLVETKSFLKAGLTAGFAAIAVGRLLAAIPFGIPEVPQDRAEIRKVFEENVYGVRPDFPDFTPVATVIATEEAPEFGAVRKTTELNVMTPVGERTFRVHSYFPKGDGKVPVFVYLAFNDPRKFDVSATHGNVRWDVKDILARGYATAAFGYNEVLPDQADVFARISRGERDWGAISCWALAASRVADWLETEPRADVSRLAVVGHSRLGKTALWAGVTDRRFAFVVSNCSGCFGARVQNVNWRGETVLQINDRFPYWFAPKCRAFNGKDRELPFSQHWLLVAIAPRLLTVASAENDDWACPAGEMLAWELSRAAWGKDQERSHYFIRRGEHEIDASNWTEYLDFAKAHGW